MTHKEAMEFLWNEILLPFEESALYEDYRDEYNQRNSGQSFDDVYSEALDHLQEIVGGDILH
jgi:hypothetical protein